jgi:hypothetical protein
MSDPGTLAALAHKRSQESFFGSKNGTATFFQGGQLSVSENGVKNAEAFYRLLRPFEGRPRVLIPSKTTDSGSASIQPCFNLSFPLPNLSSAPLHCLVVRGLAISCVKPRILTLRFLRDSAISSVAIGMSSKVIPEGARERCQKRRNQRGRKGRRKTGMFVAPKNYALCY